MISSAYNSINIFLRGRVQFPTGGDKTLCLSVRDPSASVRSSGGFGATPKPTVTVWMGEGKNFW
jgi:hypothetical protein